MHHHILQRQACAMQSKPHLNKGYRVPRYYFDLTNGETTLTDEEGVVAANLDQATTEAQIVLKDMLIGGELMDVDNWTIIIREKGGKMLREIPLKSSDSKSSSH